MIITAKAIHHQSKFKVNEREIPEHITIRLNMTTRALFARMLTEWGTPIEHVGDTFEHILNEGVRKYYEERYGE